MLLKWLKCRWGRFVYDERDPGIYVAEVPSCSPIVDTFCHEIRGVAEKGSIGEPVLVTNFDQFVETFGEGMDTQSCSLAQKVYSFFMNGGHQISVVRVMEDGSEGDHCEDGYSVKSLCDFVFTEDEEESQ